MDRDGYKAGQPSVGFISLGCPKNQVDCELMIARAAETGFEVTAELEEADALVVNTCAFIAAAQAEADEAIREALEYKQEGRCRAVVVAGCLPQYLQERCEQAYPEVDAWLTPDNPGELGAVLSELLGGGAAGAAHIGGSLAPPTFLATAADGRVLSTPPSLAYVKIAEGCSHRCRFCIIPELRGRYRSRPPADVLEEVEAIANLGLAEIALVSQDSSYYGRDLDDRDGLAGLLAAILAQGGDYWLRVMYLYPDHVTDGLLDAWTELAARREGPRLLPYFDVPVQHVSGPLLKSMGRRGDRAGIERLFAGIRGRMPEAVIRTSLIAGYPGETEDDFNELLDWVQAGSVDRLGVFTYSDLPELKSHGLPGHVEPGLMAQRQDLLLQAQYEVMAERHQRLIGTDVEVLLEEDATEDAEGDQKSVDAEAQYVYVGRSWRDAYEIDGLVRVSSTRPLELYTRVRARVTGADAYDLEAEVH